MNTLRHRNGRFARNPVTHKQFWDRVHKLVGKPVCITDAQGKVSHYLISMAEAQQRAELELRVRLAGDDIIETGDTRRWM